LVSSLVPCTGKEDGQENKVLKCIPEDHDVWVAVISLYQS